jgi:AraC-like DNA-binding protein
MRSVAPLLNHLDSLGFPEEHSLECLGLDRAAADDLETRLDYRCVERLWQMAVDTTGDPTLPLRAAMLADAAEFGVVTYIFTASPDIRSGFQNTLDLIPLMSTVTGVSLETAEEHLIVRYRWQPGFEISQASREYAVGVLIQLSRGVGRSVGGLSPQEVRFSYPPPDHADAYAEILDLPVRFDSGWDGVLFPVSELDAPNPASDPALAEALARHAQKLLAKLPRGDDLPSRVRHQLASALPFGASADQVAEDLGMSARNLRRRLEAEGSSYQVILDEVRCELARRYLAEEGKGVEEVAFALGFSDGSAFHKAFKRWTGESPTDFARDSTPERSS